jgi:bisanhydrobacterioruberin hydratase
MNQVTNKSAKSLVFRLRYFILFFIIFYLVGFIGILFNRSRPTFTMLTPFAILLSLVAFLLFHESRISLRLIAGLLSIYFLGFFVEVIGVNTGWIFGHYQYGSGLGIKIFNTPLFIGLNWVMLIYASSALLYNLHIHPILKIIFSSSFMVIYDFILEQIAPKMDMWSWKDSRVPLQNYLAWFFIAIVFHSIFLIFRIDTRNKLAPIIFAIQTLFFFTLSIYFYFT